MKKLLLCTAALTMFAGSTIYLNSSNVKADINTQASDSNKQKNMSDNGNGVQTFTYFNVDNNSTITPPTDPDNRGTILKNPELYNILQTNAKGSLTIDAVPKTLNFGDTNKNLEGNHANGNNDINVTLNDKNNNGNDNNGDKTSDIDRYYAQVSDYRTDHTGWHLSASMSNMTDTQNTSNVLEGATIKFTGNNVLGAYGNNSNKLGKDNNVNTSDVSLNPTKTDVPVMSADTNYGAGTWIDLFNNINLSAGRADSGNYNGTITWNLSDGPSTPNNTTGTNGNN